MPWLATLHYRDFRLLLIGEVTSAIGTEMFYVALSWQMYLLTHSAFASGLLCLAGFIPAMLFSLQRSLLILSPTQMPTIVQ